LRRPFALSSGQAGGCRGSVLSTTFGLEFRGRVTISHRKRFWFLVAFQDCSRCHS
jgi:hypothetical protein